MDKSIENGMIVGAERHDPQCQDVECSRCDTCDQWVPDTEIAVFGIRIIADIEGIKILAFKNFMNIGLTVKQIDHSLFEAVTLFVADEAGVMTVRAGIG